MDYYLLLIFKSYKKGCGFYAHHWQNNIRILLQLLATPLSGFPVKIWPLKTQTA
jgi:hypothetical protein